MAKFQPTGEKKTPLKTRFSDNEIRFLKAYFLAKKELESNGIKINLAALYRQAFNKTENGSKESNSSSSAACIIIRRFKALSLEKQEAYLQKWQLEAKEEEQEKMAENIRTIKAYNEGMEKAREKYDMGFVEGKEAGKRAIKMLASSINFGDMTGRQNFLEHLATIFLEDYKKQLQFTLRTEEGEYIANGATVGSLIKGLIDIAKINHSIDKDDPENLEKLFKLQKQINPE